MRKNTMFFILMFCLTNILYQTKGQIKNDKIYMSPGGSMDNIFDHYGNKYDPSDILINKERENSNGTANKSTNPTPMSCGFFNLYFETGSGLEDASNPIHVARRNVVCRVFSDLSNFINSPLKTNGLNNKVNIWVRNINNAIPAPNTPAGVLGLASSFYSMPYNATTGFGGIADNEIWKTIHLGTDSYDGVFSPVNSNGSSSGVSGLFYHGMMAFNFSDSLINWNTDLSVASFPGLYDLYSVVLHEITHAVGFSSLINASGNSKFGTGFNYFTRYDAFLKNSTATEFLLKKASSACGEMYNYSFNNVLSNGILSPPNNLCSSKIRYVGLSDVPVFTPPGFTESSSLSHFDGSCISPNPNFVTESAYAPNTIKRYLKQEEKNVLVDLGYSVNSTFGVSTTYNGTTSYSGQLLGITVAGTNDGINYTNGTITFTGNPGTNISLSNLLSNDFDAAGFECLEDIFDSTATLSVTSGTAGTAVSYSSSVGGLHLLRYVPVNSAGKKGNITYVYVYVNEQNNCTPPTGTGCNPNANLVINPEFESFLPSQGIGNINKACNWSDAHIITGGADYFNGSYTDPAIKTPCNMMGYQVDNVANNKGYAGMVVRKSYGNAIYSESIKTTLASPLLPNTKYRLSFQVSLAEGNSKNAIKFQAYLSNNNTSYPGYGEIPITNPAMLFTDSNYATNASTWKTITFDFTTGSVAGQTTLYLGGLSNIDFVSNTPSPQGLNGCGYNNYNDSSVPNDFGACYYFVDNVSIIALENTIDMTLDLPQYVCPNNVLSDLSLYLSGSYFNGTFSGNGVSGNTFSANAAGMGTHTIYYTYTNTSGCVVTISDVVFVTDRESICGPANNCPQNYSFYTTETNPNVSYHASEYIYTGSNYLVQSGNSVDFKAGKYILMEPDSEIEFGASFSAVIEDCPTNITRMSASKPLTEIEQSQNDLQLYPNPVGDFLNIKTASSIIKVEIYDTSGKKVNVRLEGNRINVSHLVSGNYLITIETKESKSTKKFIKK